VSNEGLHETACRLPHGLQRGGSDAPQPLASQGIRADLFERVHDELAGRLARRPRPWPGIRQGQAVSRLDERDISARALVRATRKACGVVLDAHGKIGWGRSDIGGDPIVVVLSETVSNAHLAGERGEGVSCIFAGRSELDLASISPSRLTSSIANSA
jgi:hypothetical protein